MTRSSTGVFGSRLAVAITSVIVTTVVVAGGIAVASVPNNSVNSAKIVNGTIQGIDIKNGTIQGIDIANGSVGVADLAPTALPLFARVGNDADNNPVLVAGRGVTSVVKRGEPVNDYLVTFNRSIANCGWTATINANNYFGPTNGWGTILAENDGGPLPPDGTGPGPADALRVRLQHIDPISGEVPYLLGDPNSTFTVTVTC